MSVVDENVQIPIVGDQFYTLVDAGGKGMDQLVIEAAAKLRTAA